MSGGDDHGDDVRPDEVTSAAALDDTLAGDDSGLCAGLLDVLALLSDVGAARWLLRKAGDLALVAAQGGYGYRGPFAREDIDAALEELAEAGLVTIGEAEFGDADDEDADDGDGDDPAAELDTDESDADDLDDYGEATNADDEDAANPDDLDEAAFGTVTVNPEVGRIILARHVADGTLAESGARACALIDEAARSGEYADYALLADGMTACWDQLLPHLGAADDELVKDLLSMRTAGLYALSSYSRVSAADSDVSAAGMIEFGEMLIAHYELALGPDHQDAWEARRNLATVYGQCDHRDQAVDGFERLYADKERALSADDEAVLDARVDVAYAYMNVGRYSESTRLLTGALNQYERLLGAGDPSVLGMRCTLGLIHARAGYLDTGAHMIEAAIAAQEAVPDRGATRIDVDHWRIVLAEIREESRVRDEAQGESLP
jgi:hypothetical protein